MEWVYFIHAPREDFGETMTAEESAVWGAHYERLRQALLDGIVVLAGPTTGRINTGICVFEAEDEDAARSFMDADPILESGMASGELQPFRVSLLRNRPPG
jgi:uncharacterized protein YciI